MQKSEISLAKVERILTTSRVVFWDFDGVIKESNDVKGRGFIELFVEYGSNVSTKIMNHHLHNLGMSRYEKIPIYMDWCGLIVTEESIKEYSRKFSSIILEKVINSPWVPGVKEYIEVNRYDQIFILVTATPYNEIEQILKILKFDSNFSYIYGAPLRKSVAINNGLLKTNHKSHEAVMVGDGITDLQAAHACGISFLLRKHHSNIDLQKEWPEVSFENLKFII